MKKILLVSCTLLMAVCVIATSCARRAVTGATYNCECTIKVYQNGVVTETSVTNTAVNSTDPVAAQNLCNAYDQNLTSTAPAAGQTKECIIK